MARDPLTDPAPGDVVTYPPWAAVLVVTRVTATRVSTRPTKLERRDNGERFAVNTIQRRGRTYARAGWAVMMRDGHAEVLHACPGGCC